MCFSGKQMVMNRVNITLNLPEDLVQKAREAGLLTTEQVERWLEEKLARRQAQDDFFAQMDALQALQPTLTPDEITDEVEAHRRDKKQHRNRDDS
jgi:hypothetical protein